MFMQSTRLHILQINSFCGNFRAKRKSIRSMSAVLVGAFAIKLFCVILKMWKAKFSAQTGTFSYPMFAH